jgi:hypothetical protein
MYNEHWAISFKMQALNITYGAPINDTNKGHNSLRTCQPEHFPLLYKYSEKVGKLFLSGSISRQNKSLADKIVCSLCVFLWNAATMETENYSRHII